MDFLKKNWLGILAVLLSIVAIGIAAWPDKPKAVAACSCADQPDSTDGASTPVVA